MRDFYANHFIGRWPGDTKLIPISRTVGTSQVVDEFVLTFTHDTEIDVLLPGVAPTGRRVELPHIVVMGVREGKVTHEHIYWDQGSLLVQVGLLDPSGLPVVGVEQARKLLDRSLPSNELIIRHVTRM